jgi:hypothetical protein
MEVPDVDVLCGAWIVPPAIRGRSSVDRVPRRSRLLGARVRGSWSTPCAQSGLQGALDYLVQALHLLTGGEDIVRDVRRRHKTVGVDLDGVLGNQVIGVLERETCGWTLP